jgi:DNA-binding SARP family transcriptional activator
MSEEATILEFSVGPRGERPVHRVPVPRRPPEGIRPVAQSRLINDMFEVLPTPVLLVTAKRRIVTWNPATAELFGDRLQGAGTCCTIFGCGRPGTDLANVCLTELALAWPHRSEDYVVEVPSLSRPVRLTLRVIPGSREPTVLIQLHRADPTAPTRAIPAPESDGTIRIRTLGDTAIEQPGGDLTGDWLEQRTGQLLKFLVAHRGKAVHADAIAEALWPRTRGDSTNTVRHFVHALRDKLEPERSRYARSAFVVARNGGYMLDRESVLIDADEFERAASAGLTAIERGMSDEGVAHLEAAMSIYAGDFLADERYEDWAISERERLLEIASQALRALTTTVADPDKATHYLERLAELEPLDADVQRQLIRTWLRQGKRTRAVRRYRTLQSRLMREFGERVSFDLAELTRTAD